MANLDIVEPDRNVRRHSRLGGLAFLRRSARRIGLQPGGKPRRGLNCAAEFHRAAAQQAERLQAGEHQQRRERGAGRANGAGFGEEGGRDKDTGKQYRREHAEAKARVCFRPVQCPVGFTQTDISGLDRTQMRAETADHGQVGLTAYKIDRA